MNKILTIHDLRKVKQAILDQKKEKQIQNGNQPLIHINVAMATCGIASGAKLVFDFLVAELPKRNIIAEVKKTGCMGYCYAEPTLEITMPYADPMVFGYVDLKKADEIIEKYIKKGELVDGIIPINYELAR